MRLLRVLLPVLLAPLSGCMLRPSTRVPAAGAAVSTPAQAGADSLPVEDSDVDADAADDVQAPAKVSALTASTTAEASAAQADVLPLRQREAEAVGLLDPAVQDAAVAIAAQAADDSGPADGSTADAPSSAGDGAAGWSVAGLPAAENDSRVDGVSSWQSFRGVPRGTGLQSARAGSGFAGSAVRSLRVQTHSFSATTQGGAAVLAVRTMRGESGGVHGSAFAMLRESGWAATNPFAIATRFNGGAVTTTRVRPSDRWSQWGAAAGGALPWPRTAVGPAAQAGWFAAAEVQQRASVVISGPESPQFFSLTPTQTALLGTRGVRPAQTTAALAFLDSLMGTAERPSTRMVASLRLDAAASPRDHLMLSGSGEQFDATRAGAAWIGNGGVVPRGLGSFAESSLHTVAVMAAWRHTLGSRWSNDLRGQFAREQASEQPRGPLPQEPAIAPGGFAPQVRIAPLGFTYGTPSNAGRGAFPDEQRTEAVEALHGVHGRHTLDLGADWSRVDDLAAYSTNSEGTFSYDSGATNGKAGGLVDWITDYALGVNAYPNGGCPTVYAAVHRFCYRSYTQTFGSQQTELATHELAGWVQESWRAGKRLRLSAGVRGEYLLLPVPQAPNAALDAALRTLGDPRAGSTAIFPEDRNNFGPRAAVNWGSRWVEVHAGFGLFFGRLPGETIRAALADTALPSSVRRVRIRPADEVLCPQQPNVSFGYPCAFTDAVPPQSVVQTTRAAFFAPRFRLPAIPRAELELEHRLGAHGALRVGYAGAQATQLPGVVDVNLAPATAMKQLVIAGGSGHAGLHSGDTFAVPLYTERRLTHYGPLDAIVAAANATFHSGHVDLRTAWKGLDLRAGYVFSRTLDYGPLSGANPRSMTQFDPFANGYDKGRSSLDFTHRVAGSLIWTSAWAEGPSWRRAALGGWRVSAIGLAGSGAPYSYGIFGGTYLHGGRESINGAGGATWLPSLGRNTLRLPVRGTLDLRLAHGFGRTGARWHGEAFAQAFNALNTASLSRVETRAFLVGTPQTAGGPTPLVFQDAETVASEGLNTPAFGTPLSTTAGLSRERQVEAGVRLAF